MWSLSVHPASRNTRMMTRVLVPCRLSLCCVRGPSADILVYINDTCVLGRSHKEVVDMLKSVPMGQSVDVVLRRGYPMLYNPDGCPKQSLEAVRTRLAFFCNHIKSCV